MTAQRAPGRGSQRCRRQAVPGVQFRIAEADLVYFATERRSLTDGMPLILVEVKDSSQPPDAGTGQAKSYAYWVKPAYYVITNGDALIVYNYQGGAVPDVKILEVRRPDLRERFDELYNVLNPRQLPRPGTRRKPDWQARRQPEQVQAILPAKTHNRHRGTHSFAAERLWQ